MLPEARKFRLIVALATAAMVLVVAGCGSSNSDSSDAGGETSAGSDNGKLNTAEKIGTREELLTIPEFCGENDITVALADGFGGNTWRRTARAEFENEAAKCPNITDVLYSDGGGDPQKAISDINSFAAQGVDALVVFPDAGEALLPAIRTAYQQGTQVVPYFAEPMLAIAEPGVDFTNVVGPASSCETGTLWAEWMVEQLGGKGKVAYFGGPAGNPVSEEAFPCVMKVVEEHPEMEMLEGRYIVTNWDSALEQKLTSQLLAKYPEVDGIFSDFSDAALGSVRAFEAANRPLVPFATQDSNGLGCAWQRLKATNPKFQLATISSGTFLVQPALRKAVATAEGIENPEPSLIKMPLVEDSTDPNLQPKCDESLPEGAILSGTLTPEQQKQLFE